MEKLKTHRTLILSSQSVFYIDLFITHHSMVTALVQYVFPFPIHDILVCLLREAKESSLF